ncbi:M48 family metallopeptidase [Rhizobium halophytocola]|uniref:Zn-dependent protease with chaperone function n=1 Tax=Rhizobium halophytocola TaxID=735519 RepID=A0ABS4E6J6_9HYPH|nr:M48 family metallopeptidase [Rhizobium halophytocola]MBP1853567.1 Zn-dependent protease with chaperone function [Rhizobium halophytocola]
MDSSEQRVAPRRIAVGHWHPPGSSRAEPARLDLRGRTLTVSLDGAPGDPVAIGDLASVAISDRVGRIPRRLEFNTGALFETLDNEAIDDLLKGRRVNRMGAVHWLEQFHPRLLVLVAAVVLLAASIYRYGVPALVELAVWMTPPVAERAMATGTLASLDKAVFKPSTLPQERRDEIAGDFRELAGFAARGRDGYTLNFRGGGVIGPNAFALPGGTLVLTDELVELAGDDEEAILGVLAHEIGHVDRQHSLRQVYRSAGTAALIMLIAGDIGDAGEDLLTGGAALLSLSYSRGAESDADHVSVELMHKAGHDPRSIARFFQLIEEKLKVKGKSSILSTHPGTAERREQVDRWIAEME